MLGRGAITLLDDTHKFTPSDGLKARLSVGGAVDGWQDWRTCESHSGDFSPVRVGAEEPAIMYYTSGSTGNPKGVLYAARALYVWRVSARFSLLSATSSWME